MRSGLFENNNNKNVSCGVYKGKKNKALVAMARDAQITSGITSRIKIVLKVLKVLRFAEKTSV